MTVNTVVLKSLDGKESRFPLDYLISHDAMIVDTVNDAPIEENIGARNQLWISSSSGRYFLKDVVSIDFIDEKIPPEPPVLKETDRQYTNRPNVAIVCRKYLFSVGRPILFEGWANDYDKRIVAIDFSMDEGETWTRYDTDGSTSDKWVYWSFEYTPKVPGDYTLKVKSVNEDGKVSPLAAVHSFIVE